MRITADTSDLKRLARDLRAVEKKLSFAGVVARTRLAREIQSAEKRELARVFHSPNDWTLRSILREDAETARPVAKVWVRSERETDAAGIPPSKYLSKEIDAGERVTTRFERLLQQSGNMPKGWVAVPGDFAQLDAHGNITTGMRRQILSQLRLRAVEGHESNKSRNRIKASQSELRQGGRIIALPRGNKGLLPGIYRIEQRRFGFAKPGRIKGTPDFRTYGAARRHLAIFEGAPKPLIIFVRSARYRQRFDFHGVAEAVIKQRYKPILNEALNRYGPFSQR